MVYILSGLDWSCISVFILGIEAGFGNKALEKLIPTEMVVLIHSTFILSCKIWTMLQPALSLFEHLIDFKQNWYVGLKLGYWFHHTENSLGNVLSSEHRSK